MLVLSICRITIWVTLIHVDSLGCGHPGCGLFVSLDSWTLQFKYHEKETVYSFDSSNLTSIHHVLYSAPSLLSRRENLGPHSWQSVLQLFSITHELGYRLHSLPELQLPYLESEECPQTSFLKFSKDDSVLCYILGLFLKRAQEPGAGISPAFYSHCPRS